MIDIKYIGIEDLRAPEKDDMSSVISTYKPKYEREVSGSLLTVSVKKTHKLGTVGRFTISFILDSPQGKFYTEQTGWGIAKTLKRCAEHMHNLLQHRIRKEISSRTPKSQRTRR